MTKAKPETAQIGQRFDEILREQGHYEEGTNQAVKRVITFPLSAAMEGQQLA